MIVLPRRVAESGGVAAALGLAVLGAALAWLTARAAGEVAKAGGDDGFVAGLMRLLTRPVGFALSLVLAGTLVLAAGLELRVLLLVTRDVLLPRTPLWATGAAFALLAAYTAARGIEAHARAAEVLALLLVLPSLLLLGLALWRTDFGAIPLEISITAAGLARLGFIFTGLPALLIAGVYTHADGKGLARGAARAVLAAGLAIATVTAVTLAAFGSNISRESWPVVSMMDMLAAPGGFMPRQEALMFTMFIGTAFVLIGVLAFASASLGGELIRAKKRQSIAAAALIFALSQVPTQSAQVYRILDYMYLSVGLFFMLFLPVIILLAAKNLRRITALALLPLLLLSGCWDSIELEDRAFVTEIEISDCIGTITFHGEDFEYSGASLKELQAQSEARLYFGQVHTITAPPQAIDFLSTLPKLNRRVLYSIKQGG
jgi:spore germination protein